MYIALRNLFLFPMFFVGVLLLLSVRNVDAAAFPFGSGYYINLYGGGADPSGNIGDYNGEAACDISKGTCTAQNRNTGQFYAEGNVQRYICRGNVLNCDNTFSNQVILGPEYGKTLDMTSPGCDRTVQLDVFDKNVGGTLKGYMTWYSGACPAPTPRPLSSVRSLPATGMEVGTVWLAIGLIPLGFLVMKAKKKQSKKK